MSITVVIAEDHELTRLGLVHALQKSGVITVTGEAENGEEAVNLALSQTPGVVLMDLGMPVMDGIAATQKIKETNPAIKVAILSSHKEEQEVLASLAAGADAYCSKDIKAERLVQVLEMVADGVIWIDPSIAAIVMQVLTHKTDTSPPLGDTLRARQNVPTELSDRELEVLEHIVNGKANKEIAEAMNLSIYTVKAHVCSIIQKMSVDDRTQAAVKALQTGLIGNLPR